MSRSRAWLSRRHCADEQEWLLPRQQGCSVGSRPRLLASHGHRYRLSVVVGSVHALPTPCPHPALAMAWSWRFHNLRRYLPWTAAETPPDYTNLPVEIGGVETE